MYIATIKRVCRSVWMYELRATTRSAPILSIRNKSGDPTGQHSYTRAPGTAAAAAAPASYIQLSHDDMRLVIIVTTYSAADAVKMSLILTDC